MPENKVLPGRMAQNNNFPLTIEKETWGEEKAHLKNFQNDFTAYYDTKTLLI